MPNDRLDVWKDIYDPDEPLVVDITNANSFGSQIDSQLDYNFQLSKGKYIFTIRNPQSPERIITNQTVYVPSENEYGDNQEKKVVINYIDYDIENKKAYVHLTIHENPIWLVVVWGAVLIATAIVGAVSINSVLEHIEYLGESVFSNVLDTLKNPLVWIIVLTIAGVYLLPYVIKKK